MKPINWECSEYRLPLSRITTYTTINNCCFNKQSWLLFVAPSCSSAPCMYLSVSGWSEPHFPITTLSPILPCIPLKSPCPVNLVVRVGCMGWGRIVKRERGKGKVGTGCCAQVLPRNQNHTEVREKPLSWNWCTTNCWHLPKNENCFLAQVHFAFHNTLPFL